MTFLKIIFFTFYVYNSFKFTKRSIIKLVRSAFVEYKMRFFIICQLQPRVSNSRGEKWALVELTDA